MLEDPRMPNIRPFTRSSMPKWTDNSRPRPPSPKRVVVKEEHVTKQTPISIDRNTGTRRTIITEPASSSHQTRENTCRQLQQQHQDLLPSSLIDDDDGDDGGKVETVMTTRRGRDKQPRMAPSTIRALGSMSPKRTISAPTTEPGRIMQPTCGNSKSNRSVRSLSPKRTASAPATTTTTVVDAIFDRLYRNQKRPKGLWKDPARFDRSKSPSRTVSSQTEGAKSVPAIFDRLYKNQKRSEPLWHPHPPPSFRSRSVPRKEGNHKVSSSSSAVSVGSMDDVSVRSYGSMRSTKKRLQIPSRKAIRITTSSPYCSPIAPPQATVSLPAPHSPASSTATGRSFCQACRERVASAYRLTPPVKHAYLRARSRSLPRRTTSDLAVSPNHRPPVSMLSLPSTCMVHVHATFWDDSDEPMVMPTVTPLVTASSEITDNEAPEAFPSSAKLLLRTETLLSNSTAHSEDALQEVPASTSNSRMQRPSSLGRLRKNSSVEPEDSKNGGKTTIETPRGMSRSLSPMVRQRQGDRPLARLQQQIMELQELADRLDQKEKTVAVVTASVSSKLQPPRPAGDEHLSTETTSEVKSAVKGYAVTQGATNYRRNPVCRSISPSSGPSLLLQDGNGPRESPRRSHSLVPLLSTHHSLTRLRQEVKDLQIFANKLQQNERGADHALMPAQVEISRSAPVISASLRQMLPPQEAPWKKPSSAADQSEEGSASTPQTYASRGKSKMGNGSSAKVPSTHIGRPQRGNWVAAAIVDHYLDEKVPALKRSIEQHAFSTASNDENILFDPDDVVPRRLGYQFYSCWELCLLQRLIRQEHKVKPLVLPPTLLLPHVRPGLSPRSCSRNLQLPHALDGCF